MVTEPQVDVRGAAAQAEAIPPRAPHGAGHAAAPAPATESAVWSLLRQVDDPEIPGLSLVDLGIVHRVEVKAGAIGVELMPTWIGCPALEWIRNVVQERLESLSSEVTVRFTYETPWTADRITPAGREHLRRLGVAPPQPTRVKRGLPMLVGAPTPCPNCGSRLTTLENPFGATLCRALHYCATCRQPFEAFKSG
jgi:ring-1,2-phenylacetyl-CoA epoxidase subunit PaaD